MSSSSYTSTILNQLYEGKKLLLIFSTEKDRENTRKALYNHKHTQDEIMSVLLREERKILRFIKEPLQTDEKVRATVFLEQPTIAFSFVVLDHHFAAIPKAAPFETEILDSSLLPLAIKMK